MDVKLMMCQIAPVEETASPYLLNVPFVQGLEQYLIPPVFWLRM